ncbi:MAG: nucleotidyl transferase AbiEii/AbiGii toxin family protein [Balneolaceae bacterium]
MLTIKEIQSFFPESLHRFPRFMLREYLQYKILEIIYEGSHATGLCFLGGTSLRIVHGNRRFSEDLDFDNLTLREDGFEEVAGEVRKELEREGYVVEMKTVMKGAWHCHIRFPGLLFEEGLTGHREEKILIQLDMEPQEYEYEPEKFILNRFDIFTTILVTPLPLLMAQKLYAILNRNRSKGRDFYDLTFLMSKETKPDYEYLDAKLSLSDPASLKKAVLERCGRLEMDIMADDVEPFLFERSGKRKVTQFENIVKQYSF